MPTYQYACTECGHRFDAVQSFSDAALTDCPECGGQLRKVFGSVGVVFKGSGFYRTDSRSAAKASAGAKSASANEGASAGSGGGGHGTDAGGSGSGKSESPSKSSAASTPAPSSSTASGTKAAAS